MSHDMTVTDHEVPIAVRDSGGDGDPVLLLHGLGGTLDAWTQLRLDGRRTVAIDLRGHGRSGDGPWVWERVMDDVEAVVRHLDLGNPAVVGHSLGGMLAVQWALRHPECPAVVNLDGLRSAESDASNYPGMDPATRDEALANLKATFDALVATAGQSRPSARLLEEVRYTQEFRDTIPLLRQVTCPVLVVIPTQDPPGMPGGELMEAFRRGVRRDLAGLADHVEVRELDAGHGMLAERPREVESFISGFLAARPSPAG